MPFSYNQMDNGPSTSSLNQETPEVLSPFPPRAAPTLAGASEMTDIRTLLREWVTSISGIMPSVLDCLLRRTSEIIREMCFIGSRLTASDLSPEPMEEDVLQVVKYCTDLIEDKDLEKLDLVIKYMKR